MVDAVLQTRGLCKTYFGRVNTPVLHDISIKIARGSFTALIGPSGSGKSTLLNCLGLLDPPTAGRIEIDGQIIQTRNVNELAAFRNRNIGFIFQFHYLLPEFSALENVLLPSWIAAGKPASKKRKEALRIMERIGVASLRDKAVFELSGGQQQRVAIARALVTRPKLIFADEPTGNLDRESGHAVLDIMAELNRESGITLVMVTHDREVALRADHIFELVDGRICKSINLAGTGKATASETLEDRACCFDKKPGKNALSD
ncbi:MAG: ABC transporter ATP-binding protein [Acidobacteriota bacterium]|jgi:ABC-type lipoprotein export system ATPase subunit|nr:ABC transporter ATP-binding protein [Acidobacteriota bacterium]